MIIPEELDRINGIYHISQDIDQLSGGLDVLNDILQNRQPRPNYRKSAEALSYRVDAKILALKYFDGGYLEEDYLPLVEKINEYIAISEREEYAKTLSLLNNLLAVAKSVHTAMSGADGEIYRMQDEDGNPTTNDRAELEAFAKAFRQRADSLSDLTDTATLFGEGVKMKDVKADAIKDLLAVAHWAEKILEKANSKEKEQFISENFSSLDDKEGLKIFTYYPPLPDKEKTTAKTLVVMSPFFEEVILFARAFAKEMGIKFSIVSASAFSNKSDDFIKDLFEELAKDKINLIITGVHGYNYDNKRVLIETVLRYSKQNGEVFLVDDYGDRQVYDLAYDITKQNEDLSYTDVSYKYLTMPNYNFVISEMEELGMINGSEYAYIQNNMAFMGYVGFNVAHSLFVQGRTWKDEIINISRRNEGNCQAYLRRIPSQQQLIDVGWKNLELARNVDTRKENFDYDSIKDINVKNVKKILSLGTSLFAKCGLIVKYCILAGDDVSSWQRVERQQKEDRINNATRLVAHLLNCENEPEVKVVPLSEWESKGAGGLCCDGGKRILYREDCCDSVDWLMDAICHECYHSFQHTLQYRGWQEWHWTELGVTEYRVPEWDYNFCRYKSIGSTAYMIQVVESDARAFAKDCLMQSEGRWQLIDWE
ncbi:MAG: hypothetical protein J6V66_05605 [Clostridia bacterium]|nr:hypothetical protein [Clostridia bacterium]